MPEGAIYVGRPSLWGNSFIGPEAVQKYENNTNALSKINPNWFEFFIAPLRGHDLACWCPLDKPCHADILLCLASEST